MNLKTSELSIEEELHLIREETIAKYDGDVRAMLVDMQKRAIASGCKIVSFDSSPSLTADLLDDTQK